MNEWINKWNWMSKTKQIKKNMDLDDFFPLVWKKTCYESKTRIIAQNLKTDQMMAVMYWKTPEKLKGLKCSHNRFRVDHEGSLYSICGSEENRLQTSTKHTEQNDE